MAVVGVGVAPVGVGCRGVTPSEERISDDRSGTGRARRGIGIRAGSGRSDFGMPRCSRSFSHGRMASASAAKIPRSRRAGTHRAAGGFDTDLPRRTGTVRGFSGGGRAYRRQKSVPGRAPRWRMTSEPGYHPHRLRYGTEIPRPRHLLRAPSRRRLPYPTRSRQPASEVYAPRRGVPLRLHCPGKPPTFHPASESPSAHPY